MKILAVVAVVSAVALSGLASAQAPVELTRLFESGKYHEVVEAAQGELANPAVLYLTGQSFQRMQQGDQAREAYSQLAQRGEGDPWRWIGESALHLVENRHDDAVNAATRAVEVAGDLPEAHYQLGLARGQRQDFANAATAFDRAAQLNPSFAYAHYYAGIAYNRIRRIDRMAAHFEAFLKLAPQAPERAEVESIMKTVRGR